MHKDVLISAEGVWKKYCRDLKRSLVYGVKDLVSELTLRDEGIAQLRDKEFWVLQDINFELRRGETLGLLGHNGAGKSTLLKVLNGIIKPTRGRVTVNGKMQALIELGGAFNPLLSGRENIFVSAAILGISKRQILPHIDEIIEFSELGDFIDSPVGTYSTGMRVRLGFSVAMFIQPDILVIDEVLSVGDVSFQTKSLERVAQVRERAGGVIFVSHNVYQLRRLCTKCLVLDQGSIIGYGEPDAMIDLYIKRQRMRLDGQVVEAKKPGLELSGGMDLEKYAVVNANGFEVKELEGGSFEIVAEVNIQSPTDAIGLDIGLFTSGMQPVVSLSKPCLPLNGVIGRKTVRIRFPDLNLAGGQYFPYLAVVDQRTLRKIVKFMDPVGITITKRTSSIGFLEPQICLTVQ